eukprot:2957012-Amphidinium_carterae.1
MQGVGHLQWQVSRSTPIEAGIGATFWFSPTELAPSTLSTAQTCGLRSGKVPVTMLTMLTYVGEL